MRRERIVIVGAGPAGVSAAVQCKRLGVTPCLLDRDGQAGGLIANAFRIENLAGVAPCSGPTMARRLQEHLSRFELTAEQAEVEEIARGSTGLFVEGTMGEISADAVILAPGTRPLPLDVPGLSASSECVFSEVRALLRQVPHPASALVIGGGEAAFDYALSLAAAGAAVTVVMRSRKPKACRRLVDAVAGEPAITVLTGTTPLAYAEGSSLVMLELDRPDVGDHLTAECMLVAIGRVSRAPDLLDPGFGSVGGAEIKPFPGVPLFLGGDARHGGLGQLAMAFGDGLAAAARAVDVVI